MSFFQYGNLVERTTVTATAAGTTTLTNTSSVVQIFTGTTTQTVVLPNATTFATTGNSYRIYNQSTGALTIEFFGGAPFTDASGVALGTLGADSSLEITLQTNGTTAGTWSAQSNFSGGTVSGATTFSASGTALTVTNNMFVGGAVSMGNNSLMTSALNSAYTSFTLQNTYNTAGNYGYTQLNLQAYNASGFQTAGLNYAPSASALNLAVGDTVSSFNLQLNNYTTVFTVAPNGNATIAGNLTLPVLAGVGTRAVTVNASGQLTTGVASFTAPTVQRFTAAPSGTTNYTFTITSHAFIKGDTYTNNGQTFTVLSSSATSTTVVMSGTGTPSASGTLTWASGSGSGNITFSAYTGAYVLPTSPSPLYIKVRMVGGGGGGAGSSATGGGGGTGGTTTFGSSFLTCNGGVGGQPGAGNGGAGGATGALGGTLLVGIQGAYGGSGGSDVSGTAFVGSGIGGNSPFGGAGGNNGNGAGFAAQINSGSGGGGANTTTLASSGSGGGGGAGGYLEVLISSPASTYSYAVGAAGTAGTAGTGSLGGAGGSGIIIVEEYYQ